MGKYATIKHSGSVNIDQFRDVDYDVEAVLENVGNEEYDVISIVEVERLSGTVTVFGIDGDELGKYEMSLLPEPEIALIDDFIKDTLQDFVSELDGIEWKDEEH